jgi:thiamine biosynthesis lipoprotein ApbE
VRNVDIYLRRAKDCYRFAREARSSQVKTQFRAAAKAWKSLAAERLELLQRELKLREQTDGRADTSPTPKLARRAPAGRGAHSKRS